MEHVLASYQNKLSVNETQKAIKFLKSIFEEALAKKLNLTRVSAPLFVGASSGLNDGLSGKEKPISFSINGIADDLEIVHSLAKWKRYALAKYGFSIGEGLYTDMNAIRKDENLDFIHSAYVDQWDWEVAISEDQRKLAFLKKTVRKIYSAILSTARKIEARYPSLKQNLPQAITFVSSEEAERRFPSLTRKEREDALCREYGAVFLYHIGTKLKDGLPHDSRAADYDDWKLNGDILLYYPLYDMALEISSMGIRVNSERLQKQLKAKGEEEKLGNAYCQAILNDRLPLSIGGGIGQSRLSMYLLQKAHIGEVQVSSWSEEDIKRFSEKGIYLL